MTDGEIGNVRSPSLPNGSGAAAILAMGIGSVVMAALAIIADHSPIFKKRMTFYTPTGPLSGVTTTAIAIWLVSWIALDIAWNRRDVDERIVSVGLYLLAIGFTLMFSPVADLFPDRFDSSVEPLLTM